MAVRKTLLKTPPELSGLTLPEKILISVYQPKMYVTTFRGKAGPGTEQRGLKGNTITFPQDVVKVAHILPSNMNTLADNIQVVFIGNRIPSKEALKKVLTVRKQKVLDALAYLVENHPLYANITINHNNDLPEDDIPDSIWETITIHNDPNKVPQLREGVLREGVYFLH